MPIDVDMRGLYRLQSRISGNVRRARLETLELGKQRAVADCPVSPGAPHGDVHLYETIDVVGVNQYADDLVAGDPARGVFHAPHVNYGTYKMAGSFFMDHAAQVMAEDFPKRISRYLLR